MSSTFSNYTRSLPRFGALLLTEGTSEVKVALL